VTVVWRWQAVVIACVFEIIMYYLKAAYWMVRIMRAVKGQQGLPCCCYCRRCKMASCAAAAIAIASDASNIMSVTDA